MVEDCRALCRSEQTPSGAGEIGISFKGACGGWLFLVLLAMAMLIPPAWVLCYTKAKSRDDGFYTCEHVPMIATAPLGACKGLFVFRPHHSNIDPLRTGSAA